MHLVRVLRAGSAGMSMIVCSALAQGQPETPGMAELAAELAAVKRQLAEQRALLDTLKQKIAEQQRGIAALPAPAAAVQPALAPAAVPAARLASERGAGPAGGGQAPAQAPAAPAQAGPQRPADNRQAAVGQAPQRDGRPPEVAPLFEQPGVLTPKGRYVFEPSYQFGYSSSNRVALVGYTIIPALLSGLILSVIHI